MNMFENENTVNDKLTEETEKSGTMLKSELPIGFMDSGLGGISVLREAVKILPHEHFIYYGDSMNAPYGTKSTGEIKELTFKVIENIKKCAGTDIKALTIACNTATGAAVDDVRRAFPEMPIIGIEPAVKPAAEYADGGRVLVMATPLTVKQEKFLKLKERYEKNAEIVPLGCKGLMEFVERGDFYEEGEQEVLEYLREKMVTMLTNDTRGIVLGCTHYPFLKTHIQKVLDEAGRSDIAIFDGSFGTARQLKNRLAACGLDRKTGTGSVTIFNSSDDKKMIELSKKLLYL